jgi:tetratricopeptide (TPR) repeat protein
MRTRPFESDVQAILDLGFAHLPEGESEERAMLLAHQAGWHFAFPAEVDERELESIERKGVEAAEMAIRLGLPDVASAAFDAAMGAITAAGRYDLALPIWRRRAELVHSLDNVYELGDLVAAGVWLMYELGRYPEARAIADEGLPRLAGAATMTEVHVVAWEVVTLERLGEWDEALVRFERLGELLAEQRHQPPYFATHAYAVAGRIREARGDRLESDRLADLLMALGETFSSRLFAWFVRFLFERGEVERASAYFAQLPASWRIHSSGIYEMRCELVAATEAWDEVPDALRKARAYGAVGSQTMGPVADRLEGRAGIEVDPVRASELLQLAVAGFASLRTPYEEARTRLDLARALREIGRQEDADRELALAESEFERLRATKDLTAVRAFRTQQ